MGILTSITGLPVTGPLFGLGWLARKIAEAAEREMNDPARIERALLALEQALEAGEIDEATFEAREADLLAELTAITELANQASATPPPEPEPDAPAPGGATPAA